MTAATHVSEQHDAASSGESSSPAPLAVASGRLGFRACLGGSGAIPVVIVLAVFVIFMPALVEKYGFSDDYSVLWMADTGIPSPQFGKNILSATGSEGRPLAGLAGELFFSAARTIDNLRFIRLTSVIGIAALALMLFWALARAGISRWSAALSVILVSSLPAFQVYGSWAVLFIVPYAALLAGGASMLASGAVDARRHIVPDRLVGSTALLIAALMTYQPGAMFFWVFLAVALVGALREPRRGWDLVKAHFIVGAAALGIWFVLLKGLIHVIGDSGTGGHRSTLTHDPIGKLRWFVENPLYRSLNIFDLTPTRGFAILVVIVSVGGILLGLIRWAARPWLYGIVGIVLVPLSYLPNLASKDTWPPYRTQVSLSALIALYLCFGIMAVWLSCREWLADRARARRVELAAKTVLVGAAVLVVGSVFIAAKNVATLIVQPHVTEQQLLRAQVAALPVGAPRIAYVLTDWYAGPTTQVTYDEFGLATSVRPWATEPSVDLILRDLGRLPPGQTPPAFDVYPPGTTSFPSGVPVIDLRAMLFQLR